MLLPSSAVELNYGTVYCFKCKDYIYDTALDEVGRSIDQQLAHKKYHVSRQPVAYVAWEPTKEEIDLLKQNPKRRKVEPGSTIGKEMTEVECWLWSGRSITPPHHHTHTHTHTHETQVATNM